MDSNELDFLDDNNDYEEEEDEEIPISTISMNDGEYNFKINICKHDLDTVREIDGEIRKGNDICGTLRGYFIDRGWRYNFYESCDSVSAELQLLSNVLFHGSGRVRKDIWESILDKDSLRKSSGGGFININYIEVKDGFRGNELGFKMLSFLFNKMQNWTIAVIQPGLTNHDLHVVDPIKTMKEHYVCQLFARVGFKYVCIESREPYWYLLQSEVTSKTKDGVRSVRWEHLRHDSWSQYQNIVSEINSTSCFEEALIHDYEKHRKRPNSIMEIINKYDQCLTIMPENIKSIMIDRVISPRMLDQLSFAASISYDNSEMGLDQIRTHPRGKKISPAYLPFLFDHYPEEISEDGVYKTFINGALQILHYISIFLESKENPTLGRVMGALAKNWPPSHNYFFENGGKFEHIFLAVVKLAKEWSWSHGDNEYYDVVTLEGSDDSYDFPPIVRYFDEDFHFVETYYLKYLLDH